MRITVKRVIKILFAFEALVLVSLLISKIAFINIQVASVSSLLVILGSAYAYRKMVRSQVDAGYYEDKRDLLDTIEDPHELYDDEPINDAPAQELDLKAIVKEEKAKIKTLSVKNMKHGVRGSISVFRIVPYIFLILGFIALKNNEVLDLRFYLPALLVGIIAGSITSKEFNNS